MAKLRARDVDCCRTSKPHPLLGSCHAAMSRAIRQSDVYWFGTGHAMLLNLTLIFTTDFG